ncbi:MAG: sulfite exporter TauE/SafE family protein [Acidobacteria bacterium]|jgi:sulfite exporter TauE/SafE|nr:sulfite exporter TauE/SafE family protein [Acidobacteriota bacterium]
MHLRSGIVVGLLLTVIVASLVGSLHCVGMCGPFVAFYSGADGSGGARRLLSHTAYSGGRLLTYAVFGLAAGSVGAALDVAGSLAGFQRVAAVLAGVTMILWGILALLQIRGVRLFKHFSSGGRVSSLLRRGFSLVSDKPPVVRAGVVGVLSGFLPCGWLWAFVVTAAGTGSAPKGVAVMAAFWAGTVPALLAVGLGAQLVSGPLRRHVPVVTAILLVSLGLYAILGRPSSVDAAIHKHEGKRHPEVPAAADVDGSCCESD